MEDGFLERRSCGSAVFDDAFRFQLTRTWDETASRVTWLMFNPGAADHVTSDSTLERVIALSRDWNFGGLFVVNLFARRGQAKEVGQWWNSLSDEEQHGETEKNDRFIEMSLKQSELLVCAWGVDLPKTSGTAVKGNEVVRRIFARNPDLAAKFRDPQRVVSLGEEARHPNPRDRSNLPRIYSPYPWNA